jgi:hypothetical protein
MKPLPNPMTDRIQDRLVIRESNLAIYERYSAVLVWFQRYAEVCAMVINLGQNWILADK